MRRRSLLGALSSLAFACGPRERPALPSAPRVTSAEDFVPSDLDVVARVDLSRIKSALGELASRALAREALGQATSRGGEDPEPLLLDSLVSAERVYLAYRPSPRLLPLDRVLITEGRFEPLSAPPSGFGRPRDLGADLRYWDRKLGRELPRSATARIYAQGESLRAFVSEAEIDAIERALSSPPSPRRLLPPPEGALSLAARPGLLGRLASGSLRELLERAEALELTFDLETDRARLKIALVLASADDAAALTRAAGVLLEQLPAPLMAASHLETVEARLLLTASVRREELAALIGCSDRGSGNACPW